MDKRIINFPKLVSWQPDFFALVEKYPENSIFVIKSKRQVAKTTTTNLLLIKYAVEKPGCESIFVSPTLTQSRKVYQSTLKMLNTIPIIESSNGSALEIFFSNGSIIRYKSAEQSESALRGFTVSGVLVIDESAFIPDNIFPVLFPYVNVNKAPIVLTSTPLFKSGFFYDMFTSTMPNVHTLDVNDYDTSFFITEEQIEQYRQLLPTQRFNAEYLGLWMEENSTVFGEFKDILSDNFRTGDYYYAGVDFGTGSEKDSTVISIFNNFHQQVYIGAWNDLDSMATISKLAEIINTYHPRRTLVEKNSIGKVFYDILKTKVKDQICTFTTTNESKNKIISNLQVEIQEKKCQLLNNTELKRQLTGYEIEKTKTGKITYNGKPGVHDDYVMSTAIALWNFKTGDYIVR